MPHTHWTEQQPNYALLAKTAIDRCRRLAEFSEQAGRIMRTFLSEPMHACHQELSLWMQRLDMKITVDAIGNLHGLYGSGNRQRLLVGSHLDTVPDAGAFDGILGVCIALSLVEAVQQTRLPFDVEVIGFSEEEGVRFRKPFLGSLAVVGRLRAAILDYCDADGCSIRQACQNFGLDPNQISSCEIAESAMAFLEFHIEQGPVLERLDESVAVVEAIAGQSRLDVVFSGRANHAGTTPMDLRRDALSGAAEWISKVEAHARATKGLVATVGKLQVRPGVSNVVPGEVKASLDVRHAIDGVRLSAVDYLVGEATRIASERQLEADVHVHLNQSAVTMDEGLVRTLERAIESIGQIPRRMVSGAGHDAMIIAERVPSAMVFLRSVGGISHHPDEAVRAEDVEKAIRVGVATIKQMAEEFAR